MKFHLLFSICWYWNGSLRYCDAEFWFYWFHISSKQPLLRSQSYPASMFQWIQVFIQINEMMIYPTLSNTHSTYVSKLIFFYHFDSILVDFLDAFNTTRAWQEEYKLLITKIVLIRNHIFLIKSNIILMIDVLIIQVLY